MGRRKIKEEVESVKERQQTDRQDRQQITQRMPKHLVERVENYAEEYGLSRNSAINLLVDKGLKHD